MYCGMNIDISMLILLPMKQTSNRSIEINVDISYIIFPSIVFFIISHTTIITLYKYLANTDYAWVKVYVV